MRIIPAGPAGRRGTRPPRYRGTRRARKRPAALLRLPRVPGLATGARAGGFIALELLAEIDRREADLAAREADLNRKQSVTARIQREAGRAAALDEIAAHERIGAGIDVDGEGRERRARRVEERVLVDLGVRLAVGPPRLPRFGIGVLPQRARVHVRVRRRLRRRGLRGFGRHARSAHVIGVLPASPARGGEQRREKQQGERTRPTRRPSFFVTHMIPPSESFEPDFGR